MGRTRATLGALVPLTVLLAGCSGSDQQPTTQPVSSPSPTATTTSPAPSAATTGGTADAPTAVTATTDLLGWAPVPGATSRTVTTDGTWSISQNERRGTATLTGPIATTTPAGVTGTVSDALLSDTYAVVVHQDPQEQDPAVAVVTDLTTGATTTLDGDTPGAPTVSGGTWALDGDRAAYATRGPDDAYCLAEADLAAGTSSVVWCAEPRQGFNAVHLGAFGDTLMSFDDAQPACRTVAAVAGGALAPFTGVTACKGFEGVLTGEGAVWSVVPKDNRIEAADYYARAGEGYYALGPGTSGTLTTCGDAAYFVRDPQTDTDPARLMRWDGATLSVVYESQGGQAFLGEPRCAGSVLTVSSFAEAGDEQISAPVG